ncbi:MAG: DNA-processing protein DprA [Alphaproteobacteria bacterium]|nr:DNA-processing protein DprA [Alphaproteobacteria bacterium]
MTSHLFAVRKPAILSEEDKIAWLRLARTENVGPVTFHRLLGRYGNAQRALEALPDLSRKGGRAAPLTPAKKEVAEKEYAALRQIGGRIITAACPDYPLALAATDDAPPVISILGDSTLLQRSCLAMVGARNASINGMRFAQGLAGELGRLGQVIVSGLARGIDTAAHKGALDTGTIAVVAGGIDVIYPEENQGLYEQIRERGLIVAESALGQKPFAQSFPRRNRIVSGLSKGVVVVEATMKSGSLITARLAGEQGRDVYAVPGHPLDPRAQGPNHLIRQGAALVRNAQDILETLNDFSGGGLREPYGTVYDAPFPMGEEADIPADLQDAVIGHLSFAPSGIDELVRACQVSVPAVQTALLELELAGRVKRLPGNRVSLVQ